MDEILIRHINEAAVKQHEARGNAPQNKPKNWAEIEAYAEWIASIRVREELLRLKEELESK